MNSEVYVSEPSFDKEIEIAGNKIRYGKLNNRVYVTDTSIDLPNQFHRKVESFANENGLGKIIAKVQDSHVLPFLKHGYEIEATVPGYFGIQDAIFVSKFIDEKRKKCKHEEACDDILLKLEQETAWDPTSFNQPVVFRKSNESDAFSIAKLYQHTFNHHGQPVFDAEFIQQSLKQGVEYYCVEYLETIVACVRIEREHNARNARLYDMVVLSHLRNSGIGTALINQVKHYLKKSDIEFVYSVCRAPSYAVNKVFARLDFEYGGRLTNNNLVDRDLVSMNVWSHRLQ